MNIPNVDVVPALTTGDPFTIGEVGTGGDGITTSAALTVNIFNGTTSKVPTPSATGDQTLLTITALDGTSTNVTSSILVDQFSERAILTQTANATAGLGQIVIDLGVTMDVLQESISDNRAGTTFHGFNFFNYDIRSFGAPTNTVSIYLLNQTTAILTATGYPGPAAGTTANAITLVANGTNQGLVSLEGATVALFGTGVTTVQNLGLFIEFDMTTGVLGGGNTGVRGIDGGEVVVADFFSFGFTDDGVQANERTANQIVRIEAEESGDNTSTFEGSLEYVMMNQLNIIDESTFLGLSPIAQDPSFIVIEDLTDEDSPRVSFVDVGADGVSAFISDQEEAPSHSGVVSLNADSYKVADTVEVTLEDLDLNVDSDLIDIYTVVADPGDVDNDVVGTDVDAPLDALSFGSQGRLLDITFDDIKWEDALGTCTTVDFPGLGATGFTLVETDIASGVFFGDFEIPIDWCRTNLLYFQPMVLTRVLFL